MADEELSVARAGRADDFALRKFLSDQFGLISTERWTWFFRDNPDGDACIAAGRVGGEWVGMNAVVPRNMTRRGAPLVAGQDSYLVTHSGYRRRGIMRQVVVRNWEESERDGIDLVFIFQARDNPSRPGFVRCGARDLGRVVQRLRVLDASYLLRRKIPIPGLAALLAPLANAVLRAFEPAPSSAFRAVIAPRFDERFTELWRRVAPSLDCAFARDAEWLTYRFCDHPEKTYEILALEGADRLSGYAVLEHRPDSGDQPMKTMVIDYLAEVDGSAGADLLAAIFRRAREAKSAAVYAWIDEPAPWFDAFRRAGFVRQKGVHGVFLNRASARRPDLAEIGLGSWYLSMGDSDLY